MTYPLSIRRSGTRRAAATSAAAVILTLALTRRLSPRRRPALRRLNPTSLEGRLKSRLRRSLALAGRRNPLIAQAGFLGIRQLGVRRTSSPARVVCRANTP
jgi:hypothetical protein